MTTEEQQVGELVKNEVKGYVVKLVSSEQLILNLGSSDGVAVGALFDVLDPHTRDVTDPITKENLGSIDHVLARVKVVTVSERMSIAQRGARPGLSGISQILSGSSGVSVISASASKWDNGVEPTFPVRYVGQARSQD